MPDQTENGRDLALKWLDTALRDNVISHSDRRLVRSNWLTNDFMHLRSDLTEREWNHYLEQSEQAHAIVARASQNYYKHSITE